METVKNKKIKVFTLICLVLALAAGVIRTFMLAKIVEPDTGLYFANAGLAHIFEFGVLALGAVVFLFGKRLFKKVDCPTEVTSESTATVFASALCAFMFFSIFVYGIYAAFIGESQLGKLMLVQVILCIPCGINHLFVCAKVRREKTASQALLAMSVPVMFAIRIIELFMRTDTQINTSQRSLELLMLCAIMLFFLGESSFLVTKNTDEQDEKMSGFAKYYIAAMGVVMLTIIAVVPYLLVSVFWVFETDFLLMDVLECCVMLYAASRLIAAHK